MMAGMDGTAPTGIAPASRTTTGWTAFPSVLGRCGVAWGPSGITGTALPDEPGSVEGYLAGRYPDVGSTEPPPAVADAIGRMQAVLAGQSTDDLVDVALDLTGVSEFAADVYRLARQVPPGRTTTYGAIAAHLGGPTVARAVGRALGDNPFPIIVPCHRVTGADGTIGGFSAPGGARTKRHMLLIERADEQHEPGLFGAAEIYPQPGGQVSAPTSRPPR
jgi:methylated-DNA-[protein]-cysteine S-methyltransferase